MGVEVLPRDLLLAPERLERAGDGLQRAGVLEVVRHPLAGDADALAAVGAVDDLQRARLNVLGHVGDGDLGAAVVTRDEAADALGGHVFLHLGEDDGMGAEDALLLAERAGRLVGDDALQRRDELAARPILFEEAAVHLQPVDLRARLVGGHEDVRGRDGLAAAGAGAGGGRARAVVGDADRAELVAAWERDGLLHHLGADDAEEVVDIADEDAGVEKREVDGGRHGEEKTEEVGRGRRRRRREGHGDGSRGCIVGSGEGGSWCGVACLL